MRKQIPHICLCCLETFHSSAHNVLYCPKTECQTAKIKRQRVQIASRQQGEYRYYRKNTPNAIRRRYCQHPVGMEESACGRPVKAGNFPHCVIHSNSNAVAEGFECL